MTVISHTRWYSTTSRVVCTQDAESSNSTSAACVNFCQCGVTVQDLFLYCAFALVLQLAIFSLYLSRVRRRPHDTASVIQHVGDTLVAAAPTGICTVIITSLCRCVADLKRQGISVQDTKKIKTAAAVNTVVVDKTGTLTGSMVSPPPPPQPMHFPDSPNNRGHVQKSCRQHA